MVKANFKFKKKPKKILTQEDLNHRFKGMLIIGIIGILFGGAGYLYSHRIITRNNNLLTYQENQIASLQNHIDVTQAALNKKQKQATQAITGLSYVRQNQDDQTSTDFLKMACTWSSAKQYSDLRQKLMKQYKISPKSKYMTDFMPKLGSSDAEDAKMFNEDHINLQYVDQKSFITNISDNTYSYFTVVDLEAKDKKGAVSDGQIALTYQVDGHQQMKNIDAVEVGYNDDDN